jgi:hypothetical protein
VCKHINYVVAKNASCWQDLKWDVNITTAYHAKLKATTRYSSAVLMYCPALKAAIYYWYHTRKTKVFLIGFSKFRQHASAKITTRCYSSDLFRFKNTLCYHRVIAIDVPSAKKTIKQRHHACKQYAQGSQVICKTGMSFEQVQASKHLNKLLFITAQSLK